MSGNVLGSDSEDRKPDVKVKPDLEPLEDDDLLSPLPVRSLQSVFDTLDYLISQDGYLCASCPVHRRKAFRDMKDLRRHMISHVNGGRSSSTTEIRCSHCGVSYRTVLLLRKHLMEELDREYGGRSTEGSGAIDNGFDDSDDEKEVINYVVKAGMLTCSVCEAEFGPVTKWNKEKFKLHVGKEHWKPAPFRCEECGKRFSEEDKLEKHTKKHVLANSVGWMGNQPSTSNKVEDAEEASKDPVDIQPDLLPQPEVTIKVEPEDESEPCSIVIQQPESSESSDSESDGDKPVYSSLKAKAKAERIARKEMLLKTAVRQISDGSDGPIILACNLCDQGFLKQELLDRHMAHKHDNRDRPFACSQCPKTYISNGNLQEHIRRVHTGKKFSCKICNITLSAKNSWKRHMRGHSDEGHCCDICKEKFSSHSVLVTHKRRVHQNETKNFICVDCGSTFNSNSALRDHRLSHTDIRKHECPTCGMKFKRSQNLQSHLKTHVEGRSVVANKSHKCPDCDEVFTTKGELAKHKSVHGRMTCRLCGSTFADQFELMRHRREDHNISKRDSAVPCRTCYQRFDDLEEMLEHRAEAHPMLNQLECEICKSVFGSAQALRSHMKGHAPKTRFHDCPNCDESFNCALMLQNHLKEVHADILSHVCELCGSGYPTRKQLVAHIGRHRNPERRRNSNAPGHYICDFCGKEYNFRATLRRHLANHHIKNQNLKCEVCDKQLFSAEGLKMHMRSHDDEQQFVCETCGKGFSQPYRLRTHMAQHSRENAEERCPICNRAFRNKTKLELHIKSHIGETDFHCEPCQRYFASDILYQKHIQRIHQASTPCPICAKIFPTEKKMKNHIRIHDNPTYLECPTCFSCIKNKKQYASHVKIHLNEGVRTPCRFCPLTFALPKSARVHEKKIHGEPPAQGASEAQEGTSGVTPAKKKKKVKQETVAAGELDPLGIMGIAYGEREDDVSVG